MRFRIYYGDGSTYWGDPYLAPTTNGQVIAFEREDGTVALCHGHQERGIFCYSQIGWLCCDMAGYYDYMMQNGPRKVVFGRTIRDADFWTIVGRAGKEGIG